MPSIVYRYVNFINFFLLPCSGFSTLISRFAFYSGRITKFRVGHGPAQVLYTPVAAAKSQLMAFLDLHITLPTYLTSSLAPEQLLLVTELSPSLSELNHVFSFSPPENWFLSESLQGNCFVAYYCSPKHALLKLRWCQSRVVCPSCTSGWQNDPLCCRSEQR